MIMGPWWWHSERPRGGRSLPKQGTGRFKRRKMPEKPQPLPSVHLAAMARTCHGPPQPWAIPRTPSLETEREWGSLCYTLLSACPLGFTHTAPEEDTAASSWRPATEAPEPPEEPRLRALTVSSVTPDSLHLSWTVAQGPFDSFVVQYQDIDGQPQALLVGGDQNKVLVSGLEPSTSYRFFLYGLHRGSHLGPVSAEGTTGTCF